MKDMNKCTEIVFKEIQSNLVLSVPVKDCVNFHMQAVRDGVNVEVVLSSLRASLFRLIYFDILSSTESSSNIFEELITYVLDEINFSEIARALLFSKDL